MRSVPRIHEIIVLFISILFLVIGFIFNEWILTKILIPYISIGAHNRIILWVLSLILICLGTLLMLFRKNLQFQINLIIFVSATILCLGFTEIFLRVIENKNKDLRLFVSDPDIKGIHKIIPNLDITTKICSTNISIKTNSYGMRWREVTVANLLEKKRIAFVGDSYTFGMFADKTKTTLVGVFDSIIDSKKFEVLNFGVPGYGPCEIELQIKKDIIPFKPEYIIFMFYNGNDFSDTYLGLGRYVVVDGKLETDKTAVKGSVLVALRELVINSAIYKLYYKLVEQLKLNLMFPPHNSYNSKTFLETKKVTQKKMEDIIGLCKKNKIQLIIVTIPTMEQVLIDNKNFDSSLPQKFIEEFSGKYSILYLDLLPILKKYVKEKKRDIYFQGDISHHFNNEGHYVVGEAVENFFMENYGRREH